MAKFLIVCGGSGVGLLGQTNVTGMQGELYIDVTEEIEKIKIEITDNRFTRYLKLDESVKTAYVLFQKMSKQYLNDDKISESDENHIRFLRENYHEGTALRDGLRQSPAIGGGTIRNKDNAINLTAKISELFQLAQQGAGGQQQLNEFWIVSSTAGGTGEGIHRFVGEKILEYCGENHNATPLQINFIRVGAGTYQSISSRVNLNTFFALASDAAYERLMLKKSEEYIDFGLTIQWIYTELPDVGSGDDKKKARAEIVEIAAKTFMLDDLQMACDPIFNNVGQAVIRVGFWGCDFNNYDKLFATITALKTRLNKLISPNYADLTFGDNPTFVENDLMNIVTRASETSFIHQKIENEGWEFPNFSQKFNSYADVGKYVSSLISELDKIFGDAWYDQLENKPLYEMLRATNGGNQANMQPFRIIDTGNENIPITEVIEDAHFIKAWSEKLLGEKYKEKFIGEIENLRIIADKCIKIQHGVISKFQNSEKIAKNISQRNHLPDFITTLVKVKLLLEQYFSANTLLNEYLGEIKTLKENVYELEKRRFSKDNDLRTLLPLVIPAELNEPVPGSNGRPWIKMLLDASEQFRSTETRFEEAILCGATRLTDVGLRKILNLPNDASIERILEELHKFGAIKLPNNQFIEGRWWGGNEPVGGNYQFEYRIFPELETRLIADGNGIDFIYSDIGNIGLNILAVKAHNFAPPGNHVATPRYLMSNYVGPVKTKLADWNHRQGYDSGKYLIALAGNFFDPLYKPVLDELDFSEEELTKLEELYSFYDPKK